MNYHQDRIRKSQTVHLSPDYARQRIYQRGYNQVNDADSFKVFVAELLGTFFFVYMAQAAITSFELMGTQNETISRTISTTILIGCSYLMATKLTINLSGAHLNPAYSLATYLFGSGSLKGALSRQLAQYLGAFLAAIFLHISYYDKLAQRHSEGLLMGMNATLRAHGNILSTGKLFTSQPPTEVSLLQLFISYLLASCFFSLMIVASRNSKLLRVPRHFQPVFMATALFLVQAAFSANGGPVLNPAQDFSPRLYIFLFGWGSSAFNLYRYNYWWLCGLLAPYCGAIAGFFIHRILDQLNKLPYIHPSSSSSGPDQDLDDTLDN